MMKKGIKLNISSWRRPAPNTIPWDTKAAGLYMICTLSKHEAEAQGFTASMMLDHEGNIAEATGANVFFKNKKGELHTPVPDSFLDGITRKSIIEIAKNMGIDVDERPISVNELVDSHKTGALKEIFGTGTAVTILPINGFGFRDNKYKLENIPSSYSNLLKKTLHEIQFGETSNFSDWQFKVN